MNERILRVDRKDIAYLRYIFEGYDGLGIVTTLDAYSAQVRVTYPQNRQALLMELIQALYTEGVVREG